MDSTIEVSGHKYRIGRLTPREAFHVSRRLGPLLATMGITLAQLKAGVKMSLDSFLPMAGIAADIMAKMDDEEVDYILNTCLNQVARLQDKGRAAPVMSKSGAMMFEDIGMPDMVRLTVGVLQENLGDFLQGLVVPMPSTSSSQSGPTT